MILKCDRIYKIMKRVERIASNVINYHYFFQLQLLYIKQLKLACVV